MRPKTSSVVLVVLLLASGALLASAAKKPASANGKPKPVSIFMHEGKKWTIFKNAEGRAFFHDSETGKTQWTDPRQTPLTANQRMLAFLVFIIPVVLMVAGAGGYIYWVRKTRPELFKGPKKVKGLKNWERALLPPKVNKPKDRARSASPTPEDAKKSQ